MIEKIRKMLKDKAGVSPIIAIILMVAITVVLAATIYVWVSGMGKTGSSTPSISCTVDHANNKLIVASADPGISWSDISVKTDQSTGNLSFSKGTGYKVVGTTFTTVETTNFGTGTYGYVTAGDYFVVNGPTGNVQITLKYDPTNTVLGTWTVNV